MKKALVLLLAILMTLALAACGSPLSSGSGTDASSSSAGSSTDKDFSNLKWNGEAIEFTATNEMTLTGISVFVGDKEYKGGIVANSAGNMGFASGTTLTPGSSIGFHGGLIIFAGTSASCKIDTEGSKPDKVCFYLKDDKKLEKKL